MSVTADVPAPNPLAQFVDLLPVGAKVFVAATAELELVGLLRRLGHSVDLPEGRDLRLLGFPENRYDAVWWEEASERFTLEDAQRIFGIFFKGLAPRRGRLAVSFRHAIPSELAEVSRPTPHSGHWGRSEFEALLRQSGFVLTHRFERESKSLVISRRV